MVLREQRFAALSLTDAVPILRNRLHIYRLLYGLCDAWRYICYQLRIVIDDLGRS
jgi:hypothetical protein